MKHYRPSSELQRCAEQALRNRRRLAIWRKRYWQQIDDTPPGKPVPIRKKRRAEDRPDDHN
jgi:hypothetical protein